MKQYTYAELQKMVAEKRKEQSPILGNCFNCSIELLKTDCHTTHFKDGVACQYSCRDCDLLEIALLIFTNILSCVQGKKSWEIFRLLKEKDEALC